MKKRTATAAAILTAIAGTLTIGCEKNPPVALFPLVSKEDIDIGKTLYKNRCQYCHGDPDTGKLPRFPPLTENRVARGDTAVFAEAILYTRQHQVRPGGPYLFENMDDADIARIGNYVRSVAGLDDLSMRAKTVQRAREIHAENDMEAPAEAPSAKAPAQDWDFGQE